MLRASVNAEQDSTAAAASKRHDVPTDPFGILLFAEDPSAELTTPLLNYTNI